MTKTFEELVKINEEIATRIEQRSGEAFEEEVKKAVTEKVPQAVVDELEDQNYHFMVEALHNTKLIQK